MTIVFSSTRKVFVGGLSPDTKMGKTMFSNGFCFSSDIWNF